MHGADHLAFPVRQVRNAQNDRHGDDHNLDEGPEDHPDRRAQQCLTVAFKNIEPFHQARSTLI
ncbi:hypothetical protein D3C81_2194510 [compost metagenome]